MQLVDLNHFETFGTQAARPQSPKKPLATVDSRKVTVRELRVMSVTVTSPYLMEGLHASFSCSDALTTSGPITELHGFLLLCPG